MKCFMPENRRAKRYRPSSQGVLCFIGSENIIIFFIVNFFYNYTFTPHKTKNSMRRRYTCKNIIIIIYSIIFELSF